MTLPLFRPMLAVIASPFSDPDYIYEVKWDGYRCLAYLETGTVLRSRNLRDLTPTFPDLQMIHQRVADLPAILDGEIVVFSDGRPDFGSLQARGRLFDRQRVVAAARTQPAVYVVFDLLYRRGQPVLKDRFEVRREMLMAMVQAGPEVVVAESISGNGEAFFGACQAKGLEGVMAKQRYSPYLAGQRSIYWKKIRVWRSADLVICGWEPGGGSRGLGALILGSYRGGEIVYLGKVGTGFDGTQARDLLEMLGAVAKETPPLRMTTVSRAECRWVQPVLVCTVDYTEVTRDGCLRHPVFRGLRTDKEARECVWSEPER